MNTLSLDLCRYLTLYLSCEDLKQLRCVSRMFHRLCNDELIWKLKLAHHYPLYFRTQGVKYQLTYKYLSCISTFHDFTDSQDPFAQKMQAEDITQAVRWLDIRIIHNVPFIYPVPYSVVSPPRDSSKDLLVQSDIDVSEHEGQLLVAFNKRVTTMGPLPSLIGGVITFTPAQLSKAALRSKYGFNADTHCYDFWFCDKQYLAQLLVYITDVGYYQAVAGSLLSCIRREDVMNNQDLFVMQCSK